MKIRELLEQYKEIIKPFRGSMTPVHTDCTTCMCYKATCKGLVLQGSCPLHYIEYNQEDIDTIYYTLEEMDFNTFILAKCFGIDIKSEEALAAIAKIEDVLKQSSNKDFITEAKEVLRNHGLALNINAEGIDEILNVDTNDLYEVSQIIKKYN